MNSVLVSSSFSEPGVESFLTQLLASLNVQDLHAVVLRGAGADHITIGRPIAEDNRESVRDCDLFIALVSARYCGSPYCLNEAEAAAVQRGQRNLPILVVRFPSAPADSSDWPPSVKALVEAPGGTERMYLRVTYDPVQEIHGDRLHEDIDLLCKDVCKTLGVEFEENPDPLGRMHLIKRTKQAVRWFPPADSSRVDGELERVLMRLTILHEDDRRDVEYLSRARKYCEERLGVRAASYLRLGEGVFRLLQARRSDDSARPGLFEQVQTAALDALHQGDVFTQRDACVVLGNLALEMNMPEEALSWHLQASKIAQLLEDSKLELTVPLETVRELASGIADSSAICPRGTSAYVMFDNLMKCRLRLLRPPELEEIAARAAEWRRSIEYSDPAHFARYGSLLVFGYAFAGGLEDARDLLLSLEETDGGVVHLQTWRVLTALVAQAFRTEPGAAYRRFREPIDWIARRCQERRSLWPTEAALLNLEASHALRHVGSPQEALMKLSWAVEQFPSSIRLRVERATLLVQMGKRRAAYNDCAEAIKGVPTRPEAARPFEESDDSREVFYAQGVAFWLLGRRPEAEDRLAQSGVMEPDGHYSQVLPRAFGAVTA